MRVDVPTARPFVPPTRSLTRLADAAQACRGCNLWKHATQAVFGSGPKKASIIMIGEQPGNEEDLEGKAFIGPAGRLLDRALADAGVPRDEVYVTNAVKHFKFEERGKRRIHKNPSQTEIVACRPWLEAEIASIQPETLVCLGATAAKSLLGKDFRITRQRGILLESEWAAHTLATWHPSAVLRAGERRDAMYAELVEDLQRIRG